MASNLKLFQKFEIKSNLNNAIFYLIENTHNDEKKFYKFEDFVSSMSREKEFNAGKQNLKFVKIKI